MAAATKRVCGQSAFGPSRRNLLEFAAVVVCGGVTLAVAARPVGAQTTKMTQTAAAYQPTPKNGQSCASCALFQSPNACKLVDGTVSPAGWCKFYAKKS